MRAALAEEGVAGWRAWCSSCDAAAPVPAWRGARCRARPAVSPRSRASHGSQPVGVARRGQQGARTDQQAAVEGAGQVGAEEGQVGIGDRVDVAPHRVGRRARRPRGSRRGTGRCAGPPGPRRRPRAGRTRARRRRPPQRLASCRAQWRSSICPGPVARPRRPRRRGGSLPPARGNVGGVGARRRRRSRRCRSAASAGRRSPVPAGSTSPISSPAQSAQPRRPRWPDRAAPARRGRRARPRRPRRSACRSCGRGGRARRSTRRAPARPRRRAAP